MDMQYATASKDPMLAVNLSASQRMSHFIAGVAVAALISPTSVIAGTGWQVQEPRTPVNRRPTH